MKGNGNAVLAGITVVFLIALAVQRCRSPFLRVEAERARAAAVASATGLEVEEVMALRELLGAGVPDEVLRERAAELCRVRAEWHSQDLAVLAAAGERDLAEQLWSAAGADPSRAGDLLRVRPEGFLAVRFHAMVERFRDRATSR